LDQGTWWESATLALTPLHLVGLFLPQEVPLIADKSYGSFPDPKDNSTTNIYIGNMAPTMNEQKLCQVPCFAPPPAPHAPLGLAPRVPDDFLRGETFSWSWYGVFF
jgi:hypothetical protein